MLETFEITCTAQRLADYGNEIISTFTHHRMVGTNGFDGSIEVAAAPGRYAVGEVYELALPVPVQS